MSSERAQSAVIHQPPTPRALPTRWREGRNATKVYGSGEALVRALDDVTVEFPSGRFTAIMGPSGSGKSTLMHCLAGLDTLSSGSVSIGNADLSKLNDRQLTQLRRDQIGFIFQAFNLVPTLTALENITLPMARSPVASPTGRGSTTSSTPSVCAAGCRTVRRSSPVVSNSASQWRGHSRRSRRSSSPTSRRATSTRAPAPRSSRSCAPRCVSSARPS